MALLDRLGLRTPLQAQLAAPVARERRDATRHDGAAIEETHPRYDLAAGRDPSAATRPLAYSTVGHPMIAEWNAEEAVRWAYLANVVVYRCVQVIAEVVAGLPFRAGPDADKPAQHNPNSRLAQLLGPPPYGPNPETAGEDLWAWSVAQYLVTGRFGWELELAPRSREIVALWPLVSAKLEAIPSESGTGYFTGFRYGRIDRKVKLSPDQVFYSWRPSLSDWRQPESALQAARLDVSIAVMQDRYNYAFLRNDARPAAVIVTEAFADRTEFEAYKDQFKSEHGGVDNAGKLAFVEAEGGEEGVKDSVLIHTLGLSQKDAEFAKLYEAKLRGICIALGVPFSLLDASGRTFDNAGQESKNWWTTRMLPLLRGLQNRVNIKLAPRLGSEVGWFDLSGVEALRPPKRYQDVGLPALVQGGISTQNEARAEVGLPPLPGGDVLLNPTAAALASTGVANAVDPAATAEAIVAAAAEMITATVDDALARALGPGEQRRALPVGRRDEQPDDTADVDAEEVRRTKIWRAADAQAKALERLWERSWQAEFARQEKATLSRLTGKRGRQAVQAETRAVDPSHVFDADHWTDEAEQMAARLYEAVVAVGGPKLAERFGLSFDIDAPYVERFIQNRARDLSGKVTTTTYDAIRSQLSDGVAAGESIDDLAARIRHVFSVATDSRATLIARTEVIGAYNGSANLVAQELGADVIGGKEWIATRDSRTRDAHAEADGQVVGVDDEFSVGGVGLQYPDEPNCRCTVAFLTPEEYVGSRSAQAGGDGTVSVALMEKLATRVALGKTSCADAYRELGA